MALGAVVVFAFAALVTRLWFLQVLAAGEYREQAEGNRVRLVPLPGPRGQILDRRGKPLVVNQETTVVTVDRRKVPDGQEEELLSRLSEVLGSPAKQLDVALNDPDYLPYQPIPIQVGVPEPALMYIAEHREEFPGVWYAEVGERHYAHGDLAPHLLGYLGEINPTELKDPSFAGHIPGEKVGRGGVEQYYEHFLRGENGWVKLEVDSSGKVLDTLGRKLPEPGKDLVLSVDARIQALAQDALAQAIGAARHNVLNASETAYVDATAGAVVVMDPRTGQVVAMASFPTFSPRLLEHGITTREYNKLFRNPKANDPSYNRAIAGQYPPASAFKPFVAAAAMKAGYATTTGQYACPTQFRVPGDETTVFHNWADSDYGLLTLAESLVFSCDTVFYDFGFRFWLDRDVRGDFMQAHLRDWGFEDETGIDIPGEQGGRIPDEEWKKQVHEQYPELFPDDIWFPGDNINMSVGQGDVLVTPLQMAVAYGAIANGGTLYRPQMALEVRSPDGEVIRKIEPRVAGRAPATPRTLRYLREALQGVVRPGGTAGSAFAGFPTSRIPVAGKTGTAEVDVVRKNGTEEVLHSWFAAMAPADDPKYVVVAMVEEGGHGSEVAAPVVRRILEGLFDLPTTGRLHLGAATD
jgi:penicillin-binding protein 2